MEALRIAGWESRLGAWIIDIILLYALIGIIGSLVYAWSPGTGSFIFSDYPIPFVSNSLILFLYWTSMEGITGQSIGKMVLNLRLTRRNGETPGIPRAALSAFGKAFLLPIDCLIGWIAMPKTGLRLFNRLSDTIVIRTEYREPEGIRYIHEDD